MKKILSCILCCILLLGFFPAAACAEGEIQVRSISTAEEFLAFAAGCARERYSIDRSFALTQDIDLSGLAFEAVPYFAGRFDGRGHVIRGLSLDTEGSRLGLFRQIAPEAVVQNLSVQGRVKPQGSQEYIGGFVGVNEGSIRNCSFSGEVSGLSNVGGFVGLNSGSISGCSFSGFLLGEHQVGGIAGRNEGLLSRCQNKGEVNTVAVTPSGERRFDLASFSQDEFVDLSNIAGIAGENDGSILSCRNSGPVGYKYTGYNVGGIAGKSGGFVEDCTNESAVEGRRDVGGIVGQLIPYAAWELSDNKLKDLTDAISYMQYLLNNTIQNAEGYSASVRSQLQNMNGFTSQALGALAGIMSQYAQQGYSFLDGLSFDAETQELHVPSVNFSFADMSGLTGALNNMQAQSGALLNSVGDTVGAIAGDVRNISNQMGYIFNLLFAIVGEADQGGLIETRDLSFEEAYEHNEGAVAGCRNRGRVRSDANAGGIAGTVAFEVAFDMEDQLDASNFLTSNAEQFLFAAIRGCESNGHIQSRSDCAGGIVGRMDIGAVVDCVSAGQISSQNGDYVGGIAGSARGTLSASWARSSLEGRRYVGGIAGLCTDLLDCRSWAHIARGSEYQGAVAGWATGEVRGNLYVDIRPAGVDGVSRIGQAEPRGVYAFLALEGIPKHFDTVTVRFVAPGRTVRTLELPFGGAIEELPEVPNQGDAYWVWDDFDQSHVYSDMEISGNFYSPDTTISSGEEIPLFLVEGLFYDNQKLYVQPFELGGENEDILGAYTLSVNNYEGVLTVRMRSDTPMKILVPDENGDWTQLPATQDGSYLVFSLPNGGSFLCRRQQSISPALLAAGAGLLLLLLALFFLLRRRKKRAAAAS